MSIPDILKKLTIKEAVYWSAQAWDEIKSDTLRKGWNKLLLSVEVSTQDIAGSCSESSGSSDGNSSSGNNSSDNRKSSDDVGVSSDGAGVSNDTEDFLDLFQRLGYTPGDENWQTPENWLVQDADDPGYQLVTDTEIIQEVSNITHPDESSSEDEALIEDQNSVSDAQACDALDISLRCLESQEEVDPVHLLLVKKWRDTAARKRFKNLKHKTLLSYIK